MNSKKSVAIDGPSGAGKSTIARRVSEEFGFIYVDTGAIYRTVGLAAALRKLDPKDKAAVVAMLPEISIRLVYGEDGLQHMYLDGEDVTSRIRTPEISLYASGVSAHPEVRAYLMEMQRSLARENDVVMDGRDIGTVVLPDAGLKIYLTASPEIRAKRRYDELIARGTPQDYDELLKEIIQRDYNDTHRETSPLKQAEDAVLLDSSDLTLEQVVDRICDLAKEAMEATA